MLAAEYPQGVDVVYEGVGGALRAAVMQHLAPNARVLQVSKMCRMCSVPIMVVLACVPARCQAGSILCQTCR